VRFGAQDDAAEATALAALGNKNARKNHKSGNKWHEQSSLDEKRERRLAREALSPRSASAAQEAAARAARDLDAKSRIIANEEALTYTEILVRGAARGNLDAVRMALSCGADTSFVGSFGRTPLIIAAMHGHTEVVSVSAPASCRCLCVSRHLLTDCLRLQELAAAPGALIDAVDFRKSTRKISRCL
jgi:ankyrin repeat protein